MTNSITRPRAIPDGGVIGAFTPSDPVVGDRQTRVFHGVELLGRAGLHVKFASNALTVDAENNVLPTARAADIMQLVEDSRVSALIATCGGKSSNSVLPLLDYSAIAAAAKPIIGFSDVGVLLNAITARTGLITFYGPNVLSKLDETQNHTLADFREEKSGATHTAPSAQTLVPGVVEGRLIGGNLSTFTVSIAGTEYEPRFDRTILMWEAGSADVRLVDQYLAALQLRGVIDRLSGMFIGRVGSDDELAGSDRNYLVSLVSKYRFPVLWLPIFGHGDLENPAWPLGGLVELNATRRTVTILESCVVANHR